MTATLASSQDVHADYTQRVRDERLLGRVGALGRILDRWENQVEHRRRTTWLEASALGATGQHCGKAFTVIGRLAGA